VAFVDLFLLGVDGLVSVPLEWASLFLFRPWVDAEDVAAKSSLIVGTPALRRADLREDIVINLDPEKESQLNVLDRVNLRARGRGSLLLEKRMAAVLGL